MRVSCLADVDGRTVYIMTKNHAVLYMDTYIKTIIRNPISSFGGLSKGIQDTTRLDCGMGNGWGNINK